MSEQNTEFEKFMSDKGYAVSYIGDGQYEFQSTQLNWQIWQAATAEANKRIDALEGEVARKDNLLRTLENVADELQASNNDLREALIVCKQYITEAIIDDKYHEASCGLDELYLLRDKAINLYNAAISAPKG